MRIAFSILEPQRGAVRRASAGAIFLFGALVLLALSPAVAVAQNVADRGYVLKVPSALNTLWIERQKKLIDNRLDRFEKDREKQEAKGVFKLICDFNPDNGPSACEDVEACVSLARYLVKLHRERGVKTVAWVHDQTTRHSVLPVLACSEIVMSNEPGPDREYRAALGRVATTPLDEEDRGYYERIVPRRCSRVLIRKMYEPNLDVWKVKKRDKETDDLYVDAADKTRPDGEVVDDLVGGKVALYDFPHAQKYGLCEKTALNNLPDVLGNYGLSSANLYDAPQQTVAWLVAVEGEMTGGLREKTERRINRALGQKANVLILQLQCHGGDGDDARQLAQFILDLNREGREPVFIVAYVTKDAGDTAAFIAFACNEIVFQDGADLGFEQYIKLQKDPKAEATLRDGLVQTARQGVHSPVLAAGMLSRELRIHLVVSRAGDGRQQFMSAEEYQRDQASNPPQWEIKEEFVKPISPKKEDRYLLLSTDPEKPGSDPRKLGLVAPDGVVRDYAEMCRHEGLDPNEVQKAEDDWLDLLTAFLKHPLTSVVLVMVGITCLILELKMPGVSLPGVIAAICFVLFFWAHAGFSTIGILAMLLFALGLLLVGLELFVLPGFGVPGVSGVLLMLGSIGLVAYGHWPHSGSQWVDFANELKWYSFSLMGAVVSAYFLAKYLPHVPYANRLFLKPPSEDAEDGEAQPTDPIRAELAALLGAIGVAATPLRPAGKVQFGEQYVDVVSESGYVQPGTRVQVVEIEGVRVVVKEV
jgi:membrane-bound ClpP family serine protease